MKNIVIIGGGTGTFTLLSGLRKYPSNNSVIVSSADDGGSTGVLRKDLGVMPPGDIRQCLVGLSYTQPEMRELFNFRFDRGSLKGHTAGNIILAALEKIAGTKEGINLAAKMLNARGQVLPVSLTPTVLSAVLKNGKKLVGEHNIDDQNPKGKSSPIKQLRLSPALANPEAIKALSAANVIIFGPGDLYTSILPSLLVKGIREAVKKSSAKKILIASLMTKFGQTDGFNLGDFVRETEKYLGCKLDVAVANSQRPNEAILKRYRLQKSAVVSLGDGKLKDKGPKIVKANLLSKVSFKKSAGDKLKRSFLRHDSDKLAKLIWQLV